MTISSRCPVKPGMTETVKLGITVLDESGMAEAIKPGILSIKPHTPPQTAMQ